MLDFEKARLPIERLQAAYDAAKDDPTMNITPLENVQEVVMESTLTMIVQHLMEFVNFLDKIPVEFSPKMEDTVTKISTQLVDRALEDGLLVGADDEDEILVA